MLRLDHVGVVVDDLDAVAAFFVALGFEREGGMLVEVNDLNAIVDGFRDEGFDTVGEVQDYGNIYRLCYVRGPEGLIVELAEKLASDFPERARQDSNL